MTGVLAALDRRITRWALALVALLELAVLVVAVRLRDRVDPRHLPAEPVVFVFYLLFCLGVPPAMVWWGRGEPGRWGSGVVAVASLVLAVLMLRVQQVWVGHAGCPAPPTPRDPCRVRPPRPTGTACRPPGTGRAASSSPCTPCSRPAATARAVFELRTRYAEAPLAYALSAFAAVVYVVITVALVRATPASRRVAQAGIVVELVGVLVVGTLQLRRPGAVPAAPPCASHFGEGYAFVPLVLPDPRPELPAPHPPA